MSARSLIILLLLIPLGLILPTDEMILSIFFLMTYFLVFITNYTMSKNNLFRLSFILHVISIVSMDVNLSFFQLYLEINFSNSVLYPISFPFGPYNILFDYIFVIRKFIITTMILNAAFRLSDNQRWSNRKNQEEL